MPCYSHGIYQAPALRGRSAPLLMATSAPERASRAKANPRIPHLGTPPGECVRTTPNDEDSDIW